MEVWVLDANISLPGTTGEDASPFPVLIIPGYGAPLYQTGWVGKQVQSRCLDTISVKLPWLGVGDMKRSAEIVAEQVESVKGRYGFEKVNLLGFSLGGLIARYYLQEFDGHRSMARAAFLAPPLAGAYMGYLGFFTPAGRQVRPGSSFLRDLEDSRKREWGSERCLSIYVRWDGVIVPSESAHLPAGYNLRLARPISHWGVVLSRGLIHRATDFLKGSLPDGVEPGRELKARGAPRVYALTPQPPAGRHWISWSAIFSPFKALAGKVKALTRKAR